MKALAGIPVGSVVIGEFTPYSRRASAIWREGEMMCAAEWHWDTVIRRAKDFVKAGGSAGT
jgi:hypothetical protein